MLGKITSVETNTADKSERVASTPGMRPQATPLAVQEKRVCDSLLPATVLLGPGPLDIFLFQRS